MNVTSGPSGRPYLLGASVILLLLFGRLYMNLFPVLSQAKEALANGRALTLGLGLKSAAIQRLLNSGNYYSDPKDRAMIADSLVAKLRQSSFA